MMYRIISTVLLVCLLFASCEKEEATCPLLMDAIVGTWQSSALGAGTITFQGDGSLLDDNDLLIGGSAGGASFTDKSWSITGDQNNELLITANAGTSFLNTNLTVSEWTCSRITIMEFGITIALEKIG